MGLYFLLAPPMSSVDRRARTGPLGLTLIVAALGFYDGFFGPGTGSFLTLTLVALGRLGLVRALGNTKFLNLATTIAGLLAMTDCGHVQWLFGLSLAAAQLGRIRPFLNSS